MLCYLGLVCASEEIAMASRGTQSLTISFYMYTYVHLSLGQNACIIVVII